MLTDPASVELNPDRLSTSQTRLDPSKSGKIRFARGDTSRKGRARIDPSPNLGLKEHCRPIENNCDNATKMTT